MFEKPVCKPASILLWLKKKQQQLIWEFSIWEIWLPVTQTNCSDGKHVGWIIHAVDKAKYVKNLYLYFCFCYAVYTNHCLSINIYTLEHFFLPCLSNCHIIRVVSISYSTGERNLPASVPANIFLLCWIKTILMVGVLKEVKFANIFYDLRKYGHFEFASKRPFWPSPWSFWGLSILNLFLS